MPWTDIARQMIPALRERAAAHDETDGFVRESYELLRERRLFWAGIPADLGGGGASHAELCEVVRTIAHGCPSTALALSMHLHPVALNVLKHRRGAPVRGLLERLAKDELVVCTTGANDGLDSSGRMRPVEGGFRVRAHKRFVSGAPGADLFVTSARLEAEEEPAEVLHFAVPMKEARIEEVWRVHGMRGTGSQDVLLEDVFVPEEKVVLRRPAGEWHPVWSAILPVALPLIMSAYVGVAERAAELAREAARGRRDDVDTQQAAGALEAELRCAQLGLRSMIDRVAPEPFEPSLEAANAVALDKAIVTRAAIGAVEQAAELAGGRGFFRSFGLERLRRDVRAAHFHPFPERTQQRFTGRFVLGLDPAGAL